jgi:hypothetical protein
MPDLAKCQSMCTIVSKLDHIWLPLQNYIEIDQRKNYNKYFNTIKAPATGTIKLSALQISENGLSIDTHMQHK